ncbi:MAG TPA: nickel-dependent lactate racemase, partial [Gammaproteobacteria bacterium]|nr:nickel-dependent lactate racemase [Gammaproteobacteria bacterium]
MRIELPCGDAPVDAELPNAQFLGALDIQPVAPTASPSQAIEAALVDPIGIEGSVLKPFRPGESVLIIVSDSFRQTRADQVLPVLLEGLEAAGIADDRVSILFSTGTHRGPYEDEQRAILGEGAFARLQGRIYSHDAWNQEELVHIGTTRRGTPVELNRRLLDADRVIATGAVVFHYFGGFGGGRKSIVPGVASGRTIAANHAMNLHPTNDTLDANVRIGELKGNPVAEDMLEAALLTRVDFIVNTVLNRDGEIAKVFAGDLAQAHEAACAFAAELFTAPIGERADLVVAASPGTRNFVQTHKALFNAYQAVKPEGRIVL